MGLRRTRLVALAAIACVAASAAVAASPLAATGTASARRAAGCQLRSAGGRIQHVIYLQFDNTHFRRDVPSVASDLEQMPHLLSFLEANGTLFTNDHTILISHTAGGILSSLTGLYPDRSGITVSNSYGYFKPDKTVGFSSAFKYWTDPVDATFDPLPNMVSDGQKTTPAPWVPFTRAGCDVGGVGAANIELENTSTSPSGDITKVFGVGSPEYVEAQANPSLAQTDFVGIAIHCGLGDASACANNPNARPDALPDEPGGYSGQALYGAKYVDPAITGGSACVNDTTGEAITDPAGNCGFPGFDGMLAKNTLGYVAQMQESGVPITYGYISDAHDIHVPDPVADTYRSHADGPGEADFTAQLKAYDDAFAAFFKELAAHGIDRSNTLFVITVDEGDHFAGGVGAPQPDGSLAYTHASCATLTACPPNQIGEVNLDLAKALPGEVPFSVHSDDAPTVYVKGEPDRTDPGVRKLEHDLAGLTEPDPYVDGGHQVPVVVNLADAVEEKTLHMVSSDPSRTPTFTIFGHDDFFFTASGSTPSCGANPCVSPGFAWNHGDIQEEIGNTWVGIVGPGVTPRGVDSTTWTDHANLRPTILELVGLEDDYGHDGRVLIETLDKKVLPNGLVEHQKTTLDLVAVYEQLNAPFGRFWADTLAASTRAIEGDDETYGAIEDRIADLTARRDALAGQIKAALDGMAFSGQHVPDSRERSWISQANGLLAQAHALASS